MPRKVKRHKHRRIDDVYAFDRKKPSKYSNVIAEFVVNAREYYLHPTKGWRSAMIEPHPIEE